MDAPGVTLQMPPYLSSDPLTPNIQTPPPPECRLPTSDSPEVQYKIKGQGSRDAWVSGAPTWSLHSQSHMGPSQASGPQPRLSGLGAGIWTPRCSVSWGQGCTLAPNSASLRSQAGSPGAAVDFFFFPLAAILK